MADHNPTRQSYTRLLVFLAGCLVVLLCLLCGGIAVLGGLLYWQDSGPALSNLVATETAVAPTSVLAQVTRIPENEVQSDRLMPTVTGTPQPTLTPQTPTAVPSPTATPLAINPPAAIDQRPVPPQAVADLAALMAADYPVHDYFETAVVLGKVDLGPRELVRPERNLGDQAEFDTDDMRVRATLLAKTENLYYWVEDGLTVDPAELQAAAERLQNDYLSLLRTYFGQEWLPGIDGDPHLSVLHLRGSGESYELGYFTDKDEYPRALFPDSNEQEIVYLNMGQLEVGEDLYFGTIVHELQHLIQWNMDGNESIWLNEGLSQLAERIVGLETAATEDYLLQPGTRLNTWNYEEDVIDAHYAATYLFSVYLWEQLGDTAVQELARYPGNGLPAVETILRGYAPDRDLSSFVGDWAVANALDDVSLGSRYGYVKLDLNAPLLEQRVRQRPFDDVRDIGQFGVHYIDLDISGPATITFAGDTLTDLAEIRPSSGSYVWLAAPSNDTSATLTRVFDLTGLSRATLEFNTWYDLEQDYDFAYVTVSADDGQSWSVLYPERALAGDYGPGLNGRSADDRDAAGGWVRESVALDPYVGRTVLVRFHLLTDFEDLGQGFAVDDISIPELNYFTDVESGDDGWQAQGFVRAGLQLPQQWAVRLIRNSAPTEIITLPLNERNQAQLPVDLGPEGGTLVIVATTPFAETPARYWLHVE